jgi:TctA family transporter
MRSRSVLTGVLLGAGSAAGTLLYRRRLARRRERVDIYFGDGSMVSLTRPDEADPLLARARRIVELAG